MGSESERQGVCGARPLACQREIKAGLARKARQGVGCANIRKEADSDLRHREHVAVARNAMASVQRHPDPTAHDDAVDQRDIGLRIALDADVKGVLLAPEHKRFVIPPGPAKIVEISNVASGTEGPSTRA